MKNSILVLFTSFLLSSSLLAQQEDSIHFRVRRSTDRVEVYVDQDLFTVYNFESGLEKPVLFPIHAPDGTLVTRGYPLEPRKNERVDHPHQLGLWFNYGDVNGFDFWNNSRAIPEQQKGAYGRILHRSVEKIEESGNEGLLEVRMDWVAPDNEEAVKLLEEHTSYVFRAEPGWWMVDRITTLMAVRDSVTFTDNKEGLLAIRVDRAFELPSQSPVILTDASGKPSGEAVVDNLGVSGWYENSEGLEGMDVWGKNARWVKLSGTKGGSEYSLVLMDHPQNINYPSCWHARGYGLFSINNLGRQVYNRKLPEFQLVLRKGETITFRHRFVVARANLPIKKVEELFQDFSPETETSTE